MKTNQVPGGTTIDVRMIAQDVPMQFEVVLRDAKGEMHYQVKLARTDFERLGGGTVSPEECIRAAFLFLLGREPKESILRRFDVSVIESYFPEFQREFSHYLDVHSSAQESP